MIPPTASTCAGTETLFYVTVLSNLVRGYDKYARTYDKARIPESSFPERFFLLTRDQLTIGLSKARHLPAKTGLPEDRLIALQTHAASEALHPNLRTGLGRYVEQGHITVDQVHLLDASERLTPIVLEEALAMSLRLHAGVLPEFKTLAPRSVSVLPVARACPARCPFCFSKASVSEDVVPASIDWHRTQEVFGKARDRGAVRAVITGGGEPTLLREEDLLRLIGTASAIFPKVVLITNGFRWGPLPRPECVDALLALQRAGLSVLSLSRHHFDGDRNAALMHLDARSEAIADGWASARDRLRGLVLRWVCVLQREGIEDRASLERYLDWAVSTGVREVCFKELYVSSSIESEYYDRAANDWSAAHQVPLKLVLDLAKDAGWELRETLPWGSPIFEGAWRGVRIRVAAYTEPSVLWERTHGTCRSWNLMSDGRCLASLEDRRSEV